MVRLLPRTSGARESRWVDLFSPAAEAVNMEPRCEQEIGVTLAPEWRMEIEQLCAELRALRDRALRKSPSTRLSAMSNMQG